MTWKLSLLLYETLVLLIDNSKYMVSVIHSNSYIKVSMALKPPSII